MSDWKLVATGQTGPWELYDLSKDRCEQRDLAAGQPGRVQKLAAMWTEHDAEFVRRRESAPQTTKRRTGKGG